LPHNRDRSHRCIALASPGRSGAGLDAFARLIFGLALLCALLLAVPARADNAKAEASEQDGYGRMILTFDDPPTSQTQLSGSVLVVSFSHPVDVNVAAIAQKLPSFVTVVRRDPDGMAVRLALGRPVKVNTMAAGEKLFVDLMPQKWVGMPPPLPPEIVADLTRRALDAERIKKEFAEAQSLPPAVMDVSAGSNAERMRLTFSFSDKVEVRFSSDGRFGVLTVPGKTQFDAASARGALPPEITDFKAEVVGPSLVVRFAAPEGNELRGQSEDNSFVVDIAPPEKLKPAAAIEVQPQSPAKRAMVVSQVQGEMPSAKGDYAKDAVPDPIIEPAEIPKLYVAPAAKVEASAPPVPTPPLATPAAAAPVLASAKLEAAHAPSAPAPSAPAPSAPAAAVPAAPAPVAALAALPASVPEPAKPAEVHAAEPAAAAEHEAAAPDGKAPGAEDKTAAHAAEPDDAPLIPAAGREMQDLATVAEKNGLQVRKTDTLLQIAFPFADLPAAAVFARGSTTFVVFDGAADVDTARIVERSGDLIAAVRKVPTGAGTALELTLNQPRLASLSGAGKTWILSLGDTIVEPTRPVQIAPTFSADGRTSLHAKTEGIGTVHRVPDSQVGDELFVVTLRPPARGVVREREFIEFGALPTAQGLAFEAYADDLSVRVTSDDVTITRARGLTLSLDSSPDIERQVQLKPGSPFAVDAWQKAKLASFDMTSDLARAAAAAPAAERTKARLQLARVNLANGNAAETKAILDVASSESPGFADNPDVRLMRGTALVMLRRFDEAAAVLTGGPLADNGEAALWRMIAEAGLGHIALARAAFREGEPVLDAMPPELQRTFRQTMIDVAVSAQDFATAATQLDALDALNIGEGWQIREVMRGRIAEGFDQPALALEAYRRAIESGDQMAAAQARLYATNLRYQTSEIQRTEAIKSLEELTTYWRGDGVEAVALASLTELYKADQRWRDAFMTMRTAMNYHPEEPSTRKLQDEMTVEFTRLFLGEGSDAAPPTLESVALFYDFKELTPPGRKGDELIRKLADRLVEVDLLTQAADLLTYQVKNRLQGSARAQVAAHVAAIELMDRKPGAALNILHDTRLAGLPPDLVRNRLMLESRALSELQRPDLALEMIAAYQGDDINRLRADIEWAARRWQSAAEALELMLGADWKKTEPLDTAGRQDVLRAAIAYALAGDNLGLDRLRQKFAPKLAGTPDQSTFEIVTAPEGMRGTDFRKVAQAVSVADTLKSFLEDYRKRYPESAPPIVRMKNEAKAERTADARG
jgi:tetratricopeptide (TPR) repeat protein